MTISPERQALLKQKSDEYVASMESPSSVNNYVRLSTDRLLALEAINDWSGHALAEGGEVRFTFGCDDPCCATSHECSMLAGLLQKTPVVLYPVSAFSLSEKDDLRYSYTDSTFRMLPHHDGSQADGIRIAESSHIRDPDLAMQLWVSCATESCMAYLFEQMDTHNLYLEDEERSAVRSIVTSAIQDHYSPGQVWNAMWRSVKHAAALSTRQYYNNAKAAKTIPKKIDSVLTQAAASTFPFEPFDRIASVPMGAVLTLFLHRFGIADSTTGAQVRSKLAADAALAPPEEDDEFDEGRGIVVGRFYFMQELTPLDQMVLSCFENIQLDGTEPEREDQYEGLCHIDFTLPELYAFDGNSFGERIFPMLGATPPSEADVMRHVAAAAEQEAKGAGYIDTSGWQQAFVEALAKVGVSTQLASSICRVVRYPSDPIDILNVVRRLPLPSALVAIRQDGAHVYDGFVEQSTQLAVGDLQLSIPEVNFEPVGDDKAIIAAVVEEQYDHLAEIVSTGFSHLVSCSDTAKRARLIRLIARKMIEESDRLESAEGCLPSPA